MVYTLVPACAGVTSLASVRTSGMADWQAVLDLLDGAPPSVGPDGSVYVLGIPPDSATTQLVAVSPGGSTSWQVGSPGRLTYDTFDNSLSVPVVADDGSIFFTDSLGLHSRAPDGSVRWSAVPEAQGAPMAAAPDGTIYATGASGILYAIRPDGTEAWHWGGAPTDQALHPIVGGDGTVYVGDQPTGEVSAGTVALSASGVLLWKMSGVGIPEAIGADGTLYTLDGMRGKLAALSP